MIATTQVVEYRTTSYSQSIKLLVGTNNSKINVNKILRLGVPSSVYDTQ